MITAYAYKLLQRSLRRRFRQTHFRELGKEIEVGFDG